MLTPEGLCPCGVQQPGQHQGPMQSIAMHCSETLGGRSPLPSAAPERWHGDTRRQGQGGGGREKGMSRSCRKAARQQEGATAVSSWSWAGRDQLCGKTGLHLHTGRDKPVFSLILTDTWKIFSPLVQTHGCQMPPRFAHTNPGSRERERAGERRLRVCPAHTAPGMHAESRTIAEGITMCFQARGITANSTRSLPTSSSPEGPCLLLVQLSPFLWKHTKMNPIRNPLGLFFLTAFCTRCQLSQFAVTIIYSSSKNKVPSFCTE